ncbi:translation initiation factor IF-2 [Haematospirillum jordaniae]|uniref:Translation initiation factor IF-2 n=1 Tax=Haematospirillum jordaniae TaxID=1549855 RepID=A0A143DCT8_9PROT|nr:translation initiation factor IF-2 [Haematospirillum jordaniae]AMW34486.1 translation initiation factor IF-2 [Haematospirillum jordaniae]NKD44967.1 translation initiation factor IF-2 [Haematospirillum jordaniae]NKD57836.1 translation initiation factor IF-2 [Haematospirillum jordaniae]NKD59797.1 translation initiation factor IF-2 [Haematospirillum jordaniae]NKD67664.1 translation initiation factor IF-2 [Haematospirillum jordaniae]
MSNENEKKPLSVSSRGKLELKKSAESGQVRQSFSHGRSKSVAVEHKKKRSFGPAAGTRPDARRSGAGDGRGSLGGAHLTEDERQQRLQALIRAEEQRKVDEENRRLADIARAKAAEEEARLRAESANHVAVEPEPVPEPVVSAVAAKVEPAPLSPSPVRDIVAPAPTARAGGQSGSWTGPRPSPNQGPGWTPRSVQNRDAQRSAPARGPGGRGAPSGPGSARPTQGASQGPRPASAQPALGGVRPAAAPDDLVGRPPSRDDRSVVRHAPRERDDEGDDSGRNRGAAGKVASKRTSVAPGAPGMDKRRGKLSVVAVLSGDEEGSSRGRSVAAMRRAAQKEKRKAQAQQKAPEKIVREVVIPDVITVQELSNRMAERSGALIKVLMKLGVMATINQTIDADTAQLVTEEFGHTVKRVSEADIEIGLEAGPDSDEAMAPRAPVVTVMGHVDHGKTSLLDALRETNVVSGEAGGITQHIGAYQVSMSNGRKITFIDTPGHEAFTAMRARGAKVTDIVVLVVAADDGIMPQTIEAIRHARAAEVPIVVAINKMDKPDANPGRVRTELLQHEVVVEEMGGDIQTVEVSAKQRLNLEKLEEAILLQAEMLDLRANPDRMAEGTIVEAKMERGRGSVATVLIRRGTLRVGDVFVAGKESGRVRAMIDDKGNRIEEAGPAVPVEILGLDGIPSAGDDFVVTGDEAKARDIAAYRQRKEREAQAVKSARGTMEQMFARIQAGEAKELPVVIKGDVQGSVEALIGTLEKLGTEAVKVKVLHAAVGAINESDITLARASGALVVGFNVRANPQARELARRDAVDIRYYSIIYDVAEDVRQALTGMLSPTYREKFIGYAEIREVFNITKVGKVAGCMVTEGVIKRGCKVRLLRDNVVIHEGNLSQLKRFKDDAREVKSGFDCGMSLANYDNIQVGDVIECFEMEEVAAQL